MVSQTSVIHRNVPHKFIEPSMEPPHWRTSVVHQYGGGKWLAGRLFLSSGLINKHINTSLNTSATQMAKIPKMNRFFTHT